ncbi:MAG: DUF4347 domain-containing protein, partial [Magnetovibrio sp.]|nr:DUF4347 domain-containing protein [Magnetovibrio sp.]
MGLFKKRGTFERHSQNTAQKMAQKMAQKTSRDSGKTSVSNSSISSPCAFSPMALALEPRFMFDAAGAATGAEINQQTAANSLANAADAFVSVAPTAVPAAPHQVVVVDTTVADYQTLLAGMNPNIDIILLDPGTGINGLAAALAGQSNIDSLHIISHGSTGSISLGGQSLSSDTLAANANSLTIIGQALSGNGDILLYGCNIGQDGAGQAFIDGLASATGADIAASNDLTGAAALGGDWVLEAQAGQIEGDQAFTDAAMMAYDGVLAVPANGLKDVTTLTVPGNFVTGFTLTENTPNLTRFGETIGTKGLYWTSPGNVDVQLTVGADGTNLGTFDLTGIGFTKFNFVGGYSFNITGFKTGGNVTTGFATIAGNTFYSTGTYTAFTGITGFEIVMVAGGAQPHDQNTFDSFTIANATAPGVDPAIATATYDAPNGNLVLTGTNFTATAGGINDVIANKLTLTGEGGATYLLTDTANVDITSSTEATLILSATDRAAVDLMMNKNGTASNDGTAFDVSAAAGFIAASSSISDAGVTSLTVSNVANPTITSAAYDYNSNTVTVTGTNFVRNGLNGTNDVDLSTLTLTGEGGAAYTLTTASDVEITDGTTFSFTLSGADLYNVEALLNKNGTSSSTASTTFNLAGADNWMPGATTANNIADTTAGVTVSNYAVPTVTSATYDYANGQLVVTGTNFVNKSGATNDIDISMLAFTGEGGAQYQLTSASDVEVTSATTYTVTLAGSDLTHVEGLLNKNGTMSATAATTFSLASADNWMTGSAPAGNVADAAATITVSNYAVPVVTSAAYDYNTNVLTVTGTNFVSQAGAANDIDISTLTLTGDGGTTYTLTSTADVELTSATSFAVTLSGADLVNVETILNKNGTNSATANTLFNIGAADNWNFQAPAATNIADAAGNGVTVSSFANPAITSTVYDWNSGVLVLTGTNFVGKTGATNDITANTLTLKGEGGLTYTLTDTTNVDITSATTASLSLSATDKLAVNGLFNKNGSASDDGTTFNVAAADNWMAGSPAANAIADTTASVTVSNYAAPTVTSATYDYTSNVMTVTGTNFVSMSGATNDIDISMLTIRGGGGAAYTITSATNVDVTSSTAFSVTLSGADLTNVEALLNKDLLASNEGVTYNLAAADNWLVGGAPTTNISDTTASVTVSNFAAPTITSSTYDDANGQLVITGTNFVKANGATNDIIANLMTLTGEGGAYTLTDTANVEVTSATSATLTLSATDQMNIRGLMNKNGTASSGATNYNLAGSDGWNAASPANEADLTGNAVTVSNVATPAITSAVYDSDTGVVVVTGTNFAKKVGAANDVNLSTLTFTGGTGNASYAVVTATDVEITSATSFSFTLTGADKTQVDALLDQIGTTSTGGSTYNIAGADNWLTSADAATNIADSTNAVTVSINPKITSATYDAATGSLVVTGTNIQAKAGVTNDITANTLTLTGEGGATYTLTDTADVERTSASAFTLVLSATDKAAVNQVMNKNGTTSTGATTFNIASADNWNANVTAGDTSDATNGVTVSNVAVPAVASATYNASTGALVLTGTGFLKASGATNDIVAAKLTLTGEGGATYTLTDTANVEITSGTAATLTLSATDKTALNTIMNKAGTSTTSTTTYNVNMAEDWAAGADAAVNVVDATSGVTVSNVAVPTITSTAYDASTGVITGTGTGFVSATGAANDVVANKFTVTGEGGATYTLTDTSNVEITSGTAFSITLSATDKASVNLIMNKDGTSATAGTTYNVAAGEDWAAGANLAVNVVDGTSGVTVSNVSAPGITSSTYNANSGVLVVTGTGFTKASGANNDVNASMFTFTGEGGVTYSLTTTPDVEMTSSTTFSITLSAADKLAVNGLMTKNGAGSDGATTYNIAAAENWARGADAAVNVVDATATVTVSNYAVPAVTSATYNWANGQLVITGTNFVSKTGVTNDIVANLLTVTGEGGASYTLTDTANVEITSATAATVTLSATDKLAVHALLNLDGTQAADGATTYNMASADNWMAAAAASTNTADAVATITSSNYAAPTITSSTYDRATGIFTITGTNFVSKAGAANDVDVSKFTFTGEGAVTRGLIDLTNVEVTSATTASKTLTGADKLAMDGLSTKNGITSDDGTTYNLNAAEDWLAGSVAATNIADTTISVTVSNYAAPAITSAAFNTGTGVATVTGTNFTSKSGAANDIDLSLLTFTGEGGATYTLTTAIDVDVTSATHFTATLTGADLTGVKALLNSAGLASTDATTYNLAAADNWLVGGATTANIADAAGNAITVSFPAVADTTTNTLNADQTASAPPPPP